MKQQSLYKAFIHAFHGLGSFFKNDRNGRIHLLAVIVVITAGLILHIAAVEWMMVLLCIAGVMGSEMFNHALEKFCDAVHPEIHPFIKTAKDIAAAAVLLWSVISAIIGVFIFLPKI
jgi:undecaprenol kinase/diacylglycerol kinase (ATP)